MSRPRRIIGYARVSSVEQAIGSSLSDQQASLAAHAQARGLNVDRFFVESESGGREKIERREQMQALMRDVRAGDLILVDKLDRWSRDPEFTYGSVRKILEAGASFYAVSDRVDPSTHEGDSAMGFRILFAREEHKRIKERTVGTRNLLRAKGYYVEGTPPFGYRRAFPKGHRGVEKNVLVIVPEESELVRRMFAMSIAGDSLDTICRELGVAKKRVWSSLHCRTYLGEVRTKDGWIRGLHPPILTADVWTRATEAFSARRHGGPRPRSAPSRTDGWFLRELARCARCGGKMTSAWAGERDYYRCFNACQSKGTRATNGSYLPVRAVEAAVAEMIVARLEELADDLARGPEPRKGKAVDHAERRTKLERRRARHLEAHADDLMTRDELRSALAKLDAERMKLDAEEARARVQSPQERRAALRAVEALRKAWRRAPPDLRRRIARVLMTECRISSSAPPDPQWCSAESLMVPEL